MKAAALAGQDTNIPTRIFNVGEFSNDFAMLEYLYPFILTAA
ncbi:MAG: hypothetical protein WCI11_14915 [Candidatus Methylumidiphilus sp.]